MPAELFQWANGAWRVDLDRLYPPFFVRLCHAKASAMLRGAKYYSTEGWRSYGRSLQLEMASFEGGARAAGAGKSAHNFGLATDEAKDKHNRIPGLQPDWSDPHAFDILGEEVERVGLVWGGRFKGRPDAPHVQWPGFVTASELAPLDKLWREATDLLVPDRLALVWKYVDTYGPELPPLPGLPPLPESP